MASTKPRPRVPQGMSEEEERDFIANPPRKRREPRREVKKRQDLWKSEFGLHSGPLVEPPERKMAAPVEENAVPMFKSLQGSRVPQLGEPMEEEDVPPATQPKRELPTPQQRAESIPVRPLQVQGYNRLALNRSQPRDGQNGQSQTRGQPARGTPISRQTKTSANPFELRIRVLGIPLSWTTGDLYKFFASRGTITRIDMFQPRTIDRHASIVFKPAPVNVSWAGRNVSGTGPDGNPIELETLDKTMALRVFNSMNDETKSYPEKMKVPLLGVDFGVMQDETRFQIMHSTNLKAPAPPEFSMDVQDKILFVTFNVCAQEGRPAIRSEETCQKHYKMSINPAQIRQADSITLKNGNTALIISVDGPPVVTRRVAEDKVAKTHKKGSNLWDERQASFRTTDIDHNPDRRNSPMALRTKKDCIIDLGRWRTYCLRLSPTTFASPDYKNLSQALADHNVNVQMERNITGHWDFLERPDAMWSWLDPSTPAAGEAGSSLADMHQMADDTPSLSFALRYQLEVCLSLGVLHECNIDKAFIKKLADIEDSNRAVKILEKVADDKRRYYDPHKMLEQHARVSVSQKKRPGYCTKIPSATVTTTSIYFATPALETSNRIVRQYQSYEDRFLRVKFLDERHRGRIMPQDDSHCDELFARVTRAMTHGIQIGDRHYEFLAFGSSQFREAGAYFFCSAPALTASMIREWMGNFTNIRVIAKYCARLGQCFSTTRAIPHSVTVQRIEDVERNGFTFTDGVGKISPLLAQLIADHYRMPTTAQDYPSVFQFRLAGCKGILAVDPALRGTAVQIRPSQEKFPASYHGLEICRISQYSAANLNMQLILVLSALGVRDNIFVAKLRGMLSELSEAMVNEQKARMLLQKNIDLNQMTLTLATMLFDGFMVNQEPFVMTCLRLWRSWSLKYLKEKARIFVEKGAFVLGTTDETGILRGHFDGKPGGPEHALPQVFLQIPDPQQSGKYKIIEGVCTLARNPSLHPGDVRVVEAIDVPALHHLRNVVVLPQTGDRDLANMCSGGDLDGDDYIVMWDEDLMPREWNHPPMDYTPPPPVEADGPVKVEDITAFFVHHIKNDRLSRIAVAHRYWADAPSVDDGVKNERCIALAQLHSKAVDFAKTGVPAEMGQELRVQSWPHWSEPKNKSRGKVYTSRRVLGKLYDEVKREPFQAGWDLPFDARILNACTPSEQMLKDAKAVKALYDEALRRIMAQHGIKTEFEVATTFVLDHHQEIGDYKFAETIGEVANGLRDEFKEMCYEKAGTNARNREWNKMMPFLVAMYKVTAHEVGAANEDCKKTVTRGGRQVPIRIATFETMPFVSFPWLFSRELGQIATRDANRPVVDMVPVYTAPNKKAGSKRTSYGKDFVPPPPLPVITMGQDTVHEGDLIDLSGPLFAPVTALQLQAPDPKASTPKVDEKMTTSSHDMMGLAFGASPAMNSGSVLQGSIPAEIVRLKNLYRDAGLPVDGVRPMEPPETSAAPASPVRLEGYVLDEEIEKEGSETLDEGSDDCEEVFFNVEDDPMDDLLRRFGGDDEE